MKKSINEPLLDWAHFVNSILYIGEHMDSIYSF
jgi:hypothetical protein